MKRLLSLAGGMLIAASAMAQTEAPEACYLVGSFNNWTTPDTGEPEFVLLDADGDGVYTGTFTISAGPLKFKVFTAKSNWEDQNSYYGSMALDPLPLYSDQEWFNELAPGFMGGDVVVNNWMGGEITFEAHPYEIDLGFGGEPMKRMDLRLISASQPTAPLLPAAIYCIGDFNDWKLPEEGNDNGALAIPKPENPEDPQYIYSETTLSVPAGTKELMFYYPDPNNDGAPVYIGSELPAFSLYRFATGASCAYSEGSTRESVRPFQLVNWQGTMIWAQIMIDSKHITLSATDAPQFPGIGADKMYAVVTIDGEAPKVVEASYDTMFNSLTFSSFGMSGEEGVLKNLKSVKILFTTENSTEPSEESIWGVVDSYQSESPEAMYNVTIGKGGSAVEFTFPGEGYIDDFTIFADLNSGLGIANSDSYEDPSIPLAQIYLIGAPQGWDINNGAMPLALVEGTTGVYEATYEIAAADNVFRFYTKLGDWETNSIGSQVEDSPITITIPETGALDETCVWGKGSWQLEGWTGGNLRMTVDIENMTVKFEKIASDAVEKIEIAGEEAVYFNLQGQRVVNPDKGIYIRVAGGKSSKVAL